MDPTSIDMLTVTTIIGVGSTAFALCFVLYKFFFLKKIADMGVFHEERPSALLDDISVLKEKIDELSLPELSEERYEVFMKRLSVVEEVIKPFKDRTSMTSPEYLFLLDEFNRALGREKSERSRYEENVDRMLAVSERNLSRWLAIISLLFGVALSALFYLVTSFQ